MRGRRGPRMMKVGGSMGRVRAEGVEMGSGQGLGSSSA